MGLPFLSATSAVRRWFLRHRYYCLLVLAMLPIFAVLWFSTSYATVVFLKSLPQKIPPRVLASTRLDDIPYGLPTSVYLLDEQKILQDPALLFNQYYAVVYDGESRQDRVSFVTPGYAKLFKTPIALGRFFDEREAIGKYSQSAVIPWQTWVHRFGKDPDILSKTVEVHGRQFNIIGVFAADFQQFGIASDKHQSEAFLPVDAIPEFSKSFKTWQMFEIPGYFLGAAEDHVSSAEVRQYLMDLASSNPYLPIGVDYSDVQFEVMNVEDFTVRQAKQFVLLLFLGGALVVVLAMLNLRGLMRFYAKEVITNLQQSKGRGSLPPAEPLKLYAALFSPFWLSVLLGCLLGSVVIDMSIRHFDTVLPRIQETSINGFSLSLMLGLVLLSKLVFYDATREKLFGRLTRKVKRISDINFRAKKALLNKVSLVHFAITNTILMVSLYLCITYYQEVNRAVSVPTENIYNLFIISNLENWPPKEVTHTAMVKIKSIVESHPSVNYVSRSTIPYWTQGDWVINNKYIDRSYLASVRMVDNEYFKLTGQKLLSGRLFKNEELDVDQSQISVLVNESLFAKLQEGGLGLGDVVLQESRPLKIIGVVASLATEKNKNMIYAPMAIWQTTFQIVLHEGRQISREELSNIVDRVTSTYNIAWFRKTKDMQLEYVIFSVLKLTTVAIYSLIILFMAIIGFYTNAFCNASRSAYRKIIREKGDNVLTMLTGVIMSVGRSFILVFLACAAFFALFVIVPLGFSDFDVKIALLSVMLTAIFCLSIRALSLFGWMSKKECFY